MEAVKKTKKNIIAIYSNAGGTYKMHNVPDSPMMNSPEFRDIISPYLEDLDGYADTLHLLVDNGEQLLFTVKRYQEDIDQYLYDVKFMSEEFYPEDGTHIIHRASVAMYLEEALDYIQSFHDFSVGFLDTWL